MKSLTNKEIPSHRRKPLTIEGNALRITKSSSRTSPTVEGGPLPISSLLIEPLTIRQGREQERTRGKLHV